MSDRETLEAALDFWQRPENSRELEPDELLIVAAARERLAQLPQRCEHGWSVPHTPKPVRVAGGVSADEWCPGKVYPAETVKRANWAVKRVLGDLRFKAMPEEIERIAVAVLDALRETP